MASSRQALLAKYHTHSSSGEDSSQLELQLTSNDEANQQELPNPITGQQRVSHSEYPKKLDLFKDRKSRANNKPKFQVDTTDAIKYYRDFPSHSNQMQANGYTIAKHHGRNVELRDIHDNTKQSYGLQQKGRQKIDQRESFKTVEMSSTRKTDLEEAPKPLFKEMRKHQKAKLKNLQKYQKIEIRDDPQKLDNLRNRAIELRLEKQYGNILKRQKTQQSLKMTDEQIKVWLKKEKTIQIHAEKQLALSFINKHVNNYTPLLKVVLSHRFADELIEPQCKKIPTTFTDKETYERVFEFLIYNETIASLHNNYQNYSKTQNSQKPVKVTIKAGSINEDGFFTFQLKESMEDNIDGPYNVIRNLSLSKFNLVLCSSSSVLDLKSYSIEKFSKGFLFMGCLLTPENKEQLAAHIRMITAINETDFVKSKGSEWITAYVYIFEKVSTFVREFLAVRNVQFSDLAEFIYNPPLMTRSDPTYVSKPDVFDQFFRRLEPVYNKTQLRSIKQLCLRDRGIIMLQGPPGTGKTSTLLGVLAGQYHYLKELGKLGAIKILVCTPSNTAVDHIVKRVVSEGLISTDEENQHPKILRTGLVDTNNQLVRSVYLDYLCEKELIEENKQLTEQIKWTIPEIKDKITDTLKQIRKVEIAIKKSNQTDNTLSEKLKKLIFTRRDLQQRAYLLRRKRVDDKSRYNQIQKRLVSQAEIIFTTLSSAGSERLEKYKGQFACLIVDEAGQCTEPNLLIAFQLNITKVLLIGDPCQLPATTFSPDSNITLFNRSMFERMIDGGLKPYFLDIQYRMSPQIRYFPSKCFYNGRLTDDYSVRNRLYPNEIRTFANSNLMFLDVKFGSEKKVDKSYENDAEANVTLNLIAELKAHQLKIGVITPYKQQMRKLQNSLRSYPNVFTNTIDSFQGQEKDIIIISCVRSSSNCSQRSLGFLIDQRRINVALTRSKYLLIVIGNANTLGTNEIWDMFLRHVVQQNQYMKLDSNDTYKAAVRRLAAGELTKKDKQCNRKQYHNLTKDIRKDERDQINLGDFVQDVPMDITIEEVKQKINFTIQPLTYENPKVIAEKLPTESPAIDKWSVQAAGGKVSKTLEQLYGNKSFFEIMRDMK